MSVLKYLFVAAFLVGLLAACTKDSSPTTILDNSVDTTVARPRVTGMFINGPYGTVSGSARIYQQGENFKLALENISISNGPDLHVYLSQEILPATFIDLGRLQSIAGNQLYNIPGSPDFSKFKFALIHCKRYNHLFGSAELR